MHTVCSNPVFYSRKANPYFELYDKNGNYNYDYDIQNNTDKVEAVFDALYEKIQQSSEQVPFEVCNLKGDGISKEEFGIVLKKAYIDMIPYNLFLCGRTNFVL